MRIVRNIRLSKKQQRAVNLAKDIARKSPCYHKHGAVLINKGNALINVAHNTYDYSRFAERFNRKDKRKDWVATRHAELSACLNIPAKLTAGGTIFVVRVNNQGDFLNSFPCSMCRQIMDFCGIKKVIFSDEDGFSMMRM